jgi:acetyl esterase/lipase
MLALGGLDADLDQGDLADVPVNVAAAVLFYGLFSFPLLLLEPGSNVGAAELWSRAYLGPHFSSKLRNPLVSPVFSPTFKNFPAVYMSCGIEDSMLGHTLELVKVLAAADVAATLSVVDGLDHNFVKLAGTNQAAAQELERMHRWLFERVPSVA